MNEKRGVSGVRKWIKFCIFPVLAIVFLLLESPYTSILNPYYGRDSAVFMVVGKGWLQGLIPYRDLYDHKGPFVYLLNAIGLSINDGKLGVLLVQTVFMTVTLYLIYKIAGLYLSGFKPWLVILAFMFMYCAMISEGNMTEEWSLPFMLIPVYLSMSYFKTGKSVEQHPYRYSFIYGICFGINIMIRLNNAAVLCGLIVAFTILLVLRKAFKELMINAMMVSLGLVAAVAPFFFYFYRVDALSDFIYANFFYNLLYASDGASTKSLLDGILICIRLLSFPVSAVFGYKLYRMKIMCRESLVCGLSMMLVSAATMFLGYGYLHYYLIYVPAMMLGLSWCIAYFSVKFSGLNARCILFVAVVFIMPFLWNAIRHIGKNLLFDFKGYYDYEMESVVELAENIPENERNSVWSYNVEPEFYLYADIIPCYKYFALQSFQSKGNVYIEPGIEELLTDNPPKWIVTKSGKTNNKLLNKVLKKKYLPVDSVDYGLKLKIYQLAEK